MESCEADEIQPSSNASPEERHGLARAQSEEVELDGHGGKDRRHLDAFETTVTEHLPACVLGPAPKIMWTQGTTVWNDDEDGSGRAEDPTQFTTCAEGILNVLQYVDAQAQRKRLVTERKARQRSQTISRVRARVDGDRRVSAAAKDEVEGS